MIYRIEVDYVVWTEDNPIKQVKARGLGSSPGEILVEAPTLEKASADAYCWATKCLAKEKEGYPNSEIKAIRVYSVEISPCVDGEIKNIMELCYEMVRCQDDSQLL